MAAGSQPSAVSYGGKAMQNRENQKKPEKKRTSDRTDRRVVTFSGPHSVSRAKAVLAASLASLAQSPQAPVCLHASLKLAAFGGWPPSTSEMV